MNMYKFDFANIVRSITYALNPNDVQNMYTGGKKGKYVQLKRIHRVIASQLPSDSNYCMNMSFDLVHGNNVDRRDGPDLSSAAACKTSVCSSGAGSDGVTKSGISLKKGDLGVGVCLCGNGAWARVIAFCSSSGYAVSKKKKNNNNNNKKKKKKNLPIASHGGTLANINAVGTQLSTRRDVGDRLRPGGPAQLVEDLDLVSSRDHTGGPVELAEAAKDGGADTPLARGGTTPRVVGPGLEGRLDQVTGAVGHAGPQEELAVLGGRCGTGRQGRDGLDDGRLAGTQGDGTTPWVVTALLGGGGWGEGTQQVAEGRGGSASHEGDDDGWGREMHFRNTNK